MTRGTQGVLLAFAGALLFGTSATIAGFAVESIEPIRVTGGRFAIGGMLLLPLAIARWKRLRPVLGGVATIAVLQVGIVTAFYQSMARIGVGPAIGVEFLAPIMVVVWDRVTGVARPRRTTWAAVVTAVVGVGLLVEVGDPRSLDLVGVAWGLAAAAALATYLRTGERVGRSIDGVTLAAGVVALGGLAGLVLARPWDLSVSAPSSALWAVVALGVVGLAIPVTLEISALARVPARIVGVVITIEPVAAALTAAWFLDQHLGASQAVGLVLITGSVAAVAVIATEVAPTVVTEEALTG